MNQKEIEKIKKQTIISQDESEVANPYWKSIESEVSNPNWDPNADVPNHYWKPAPNQDIQIND